MPRGLRIKPRLPKLGAGKGIVPLSAKMPKTKLVGPTPGVGPPSGMSAMKTNVRKPKKTLRGGDY